jgi:hypothetical protein
MGPSASLAAIEKTTKTHRETEKIYKDVTKIRTESNRQINEGIKTAKTKMARVEKVAEKGQTWAQARKEEERRVAAATKKAQQQIRYYKRQIKAYQRLEQKILEQ